MVPDVPEFELVELNIPLEPDEKGWPPVGTEGLWCRPENGAFRNLTCPVFVKGVAVDDLISARIDAANSLPTLLEVMSFEVVAPSSHSTVWMYAADDTLREHLLAQLRELGCSTTQVPGAVDGHAAIDAPGDVELSRVDSILVTHEQRGAIALAYPALRHSDL